MRELKAVRAQIAAACPGDLTIGLGRGADALRAFVAGLDQDVADATAPSDNIISLEKAAAEAKLTEAAATGRHDDAREALATAESELATAVAEFSSATNESLGAAENLRVVLEDGDRETLSAALNKAQRDRAEAFEAVENAREGVRAYAKLPRGFTIPTPGGSYNPDWAIAIEQAGARQIYFVAETKGSMVEEDLRDAEKQNIASAERYFGDIAPNVLFRKIDGYDALMEAIT